MISDHRVKTPSPDLARRFQVSFYFQPKSYEFGYSVKDAQSGNDYNRRESSDGNVVKGEYRVALPDGRTQIGEFTLSISVQADRAASLVKEFLRGSTY